jgi:hypothetical protein
MPIQHIPTSGHLAADGNRCHQFREGGRRAADTEGD